jgi:hypothetical protein
MWRSWPETSIHQLLDALEDELTFLIEIAERELAGKPIGGEDSERIQWSGGWLATMSTASADRAGDDGGGNSGTLELEEESAAIVADVATGMLGPGDSEPPVLHVGTGPVYELYVITPDAGQGWQLARGGVYSYHEFERPASERMTDEEWRAMIEEGRAPERPGWTAAFIVE